MPRKSSQSGISVSAGADAMAGLLDAGTLRIYGGTQPHDADTPVSGQALLVELRFGSPAFEEAIDGVAASYPLEGIVAVAGDASWFRAVTAFGQAVCDGAIGVSGSDLNLSRTDFRKHDLVNVSRFDLSVRRK